MGSFPTFSLEFTNYVIALWMIPLILFFIDSTLAHFPKTAYRFASNVKYFRRKFLQNFFDSPIIIFSILRHLVRSTDYYLVLLPVIPLMLNRQSRTYMMWLNQ